MMKSMEYLHDENMKRPECFDKKQENKRKKVRKLIITIFHLRLHDKKLIK